MPEQLFIGNFSKGLTNNRTPFYIDNDAFPTLINAAVWRGRVFRKRGTSTLGRLQYQIESSAMPNNWQSGSLALVAGAGNLISGFSLGSSAAIAPGSMGVIVGGQTYTDPAKNGVLVGSGGGSGTINYATGAITISGGGIGPLTGIFDYYLGLPVMGIRELVLADYTFPDTMFFDTKKAYLFSESILEFYNVSYYKYSSNPVTWSGQDYQQFWSANYQDSFWVTNNKPGLSYYSLASITWVSATQLTLVITTTPSIKPLVANDKIFTYEIGTDSTVNATNKKNSVNGLTGTVSAVVEAPLGTYTITVNFPSATIIDPATGDPGKIYTGGIIQLLTKSFAGQDGIKFYNGDPTNSGIPDPAKVAQFGWVNFAPPLSASGIVTSINDSPEGQWYLVGAKLIVPYKDRLVFFGPWIQKADGTSAIKLPDTSVFSWNGTAYYTNTQPVNQTYDATAYFVDQTGKGGWIAAGIQQEIITANNNEDVLIVGFTNRQTRFVYTGNDISPFIFYSINAELGTSSTFSTVSLDQGCLSIGNFGLTMTDQQSTQRVDLQIPDQVFEITGASFGDDRVNAQRDFLREWVYFSYPVTGNITFPTQTLLFNYRDNTWSILKENFTSHGQYRRKSGFTWTKAGKIFKSWAQWNQPWNASNYVADYASVVAGNPEGYVLIKDQGTGEGVSAYVQAITNSNNMVAITSTNHCLAAGDFIRFQNGIGMGLNFINNVIAKVVTVINANTFRTDIVYPTTAFTYLGGCEFAKLSQPLILTKQFPTFWQMGRKTRIGTQKYLFDTTARGEVTVNMYLSQNDVNVWNKGPLSPSPNASVIYSQIVYTCPESTNLGLTPANVNLQMPTAVNQDQIWHRMNTSMIGDTVQLGVTLSDDQMKDYELATSEISLHGIIIDVTPSQVLA